MATALVGLPAVAIAGIELSKHDFTLSGWNTAGEICNVCHTPHEGDMSLDAPLWDHELTTVVTYGLYSSGTLTETAGQPTSGVSKLCLSCHDGTIAVDAFGGAGGTGGSGSSSP